MLNSFLVLQSGRKPHYKYKERIAPEFYRRKNTLPTNQPTGLTLTEVYRKLSSRECEVLTLMGEGKSNRQIADKLFISEDTVENHITNIGDERPGQREAVGKEPLQSNIAYHGNKNKPNVIP